jgi:hypothetical protein
MISVEDIHHRTDYDGSTASPHIKDSISIVHMVLGTEGQSQKFFAISLFETVAKIGALHKGFQFTSSFFMP